MALFRFCVDYRRVNAVSRRDAFPIPDIHDALDHLRGAKYFATVDLLSGYWQLGMTDRAKESSKEGLQLPFVALCPSSYETCYGKYVSANLTTL